LLLSAVVDETYLGGSTRRKGVKFAKDAKIAILGIAERGGRVHLQRISNAKAASIDVALARVGTASSSPPLFFHSPPQR
jgi:hypothetical protein